MTTHFIGLLSVQYSVEKVYTELQSGIINF